MLGVLLKGAQQGKQTNMMALTITVAVFEIAKGIL